MKRRLIICADGTWNRPDQPWPTNVVWLTRAVAPVDSEGTSQIVFYDPGVGTGNVLDRLTGGAFGHGLDRNIADAYRFLIHNYTEGDQIYLFGFSRGAYTVRSTAGLLRNAGLLRKDEASRFDEAYRLYRRRDAHPDSEEARDFRRRYSRETEVAFLGIWDTVGSLGVPLRGLRWLTRKRYQFHDTELSGSVKAGYHAMAIDERRGAFRPTLWREKPKSGQVVEQVWFVGVHADVGGGYADRSLADIALAWMVDKAKAHGVAFDDAFLARQLKPDPNGVLHDSLKGYYRVTCGYKRQIGVAAPHTEAVHPAAVSRYESDEVKYRPENLDRYVQLKDHRIAEVG